MKETSEKGGAGRSQITGLACVGAPQAGEPVEAWSGHFALHTEYR